MNENGQTPCVDEETRGPWEEDDFIGDDELEEAIWSMKLEKSAGSDGVTPEMLKYMGPKGKEILLHLLNLVWKQKKIPKDWEVAIIVPIFKKGDNRDCNNHRGISLLSVPSKIYSKILEKRIRGSIEGLLEEEQYGFRENRSTQDLIFNMRQVFEKVLEKEKEMSVCFVDLTKAFDRVRKSDILEALREKGID